MNTTKQVPNFDHIQDGVTWLGGTTHELQRQHIPGYGGHVRGLKAENVYGKNFARVTAECLNDRAQKGIDVPLDEKYNTTYQQQFHQPDQRKTPFLNTAERVLGRLQETEQQINFSLQEEYRKQPKSIQDVPPIDRVPVIGYMGHRAFFRPPIKEVVPPPQPPEVQLSQKTALAEMLQTGQLNAKTIQQITKQEPVVGYSGFLKGVKAENQYAQSYNKLAKYSMQK